MTSYLTGTRLWTLLAKLSVVLVTSKTLKYFLFLLRGMRLSQLKKYLPAGMEEVSEGSHPPLRDPGHPPEILSQTIRSQGENCLRQK